MKYKWLNRNSNQNIIIFFNGWGMDENIVKHLDSEDYDILMFYDYNTLDTDFDFKLLEEYSKKNMIAWSMGVMIGCKIAPLLNISLGDGIYTAVNGTLRPIDEKFGIHPKIYDLTIQGFNEIGRNRFIKSMFDTQIHPNFLTTSSIKREVENQRTELIALKNYKVDENFKYNKILISNNDKIIPTKSQVAFWGIEPNLKGGHCPFFQFSKWSDLL